MIRPKVTTVVKLLLWSLALIWLAQQSTAILADRHYAKHERRVIEFAKRKELLADSLQAVADSLANERDSVVVVTKVRTEYIRQQVNSLPPAVTPSDSARDRIIAVQDSIITDQQIAIDAGREIEAKLRGALDAATVRGDSLLALVQAPKRKQSRIGLGVFTGVCVDKRPCAGVGAVVRIF